MSRRSMCHELAVACNSNEASSAGTIPAYIGQDPDVLPSIYNLFLDRNQFSGPLPPSIGSSNTSVPYLQQLDLSHNE